jgi:hypothetical protein
MGLRTDSLVFVPILAEDLASGMDTHPLPHTVLQRLQHLEGGAPHEADLSDEHRIVGVHRLRQYAPERPIPLGHPSGGCILHEPEQSQLVGVGTHEEPIALVGDILLVG